MLLTVAAKRPEAVCIDLARHYATASIVNIARSQSAWFGHSGWMVNHSAISPARCRHVRSAMVAGSPSGNRWHSPFAFTGDRFASSPPGCQAFRQDGPCWFALCACGHQLWERVEETRSLDATASFGHPDDDLFQGMYKFFAADL